MQPNDLIPNKSPEEIVKDFAHNFIDALILRLKISFATIVGLVVFFGTLLAGSMVFDEFLFAAIPALVLFGVTMGGIMKLIR